MNDFQGLLSSDYGFKPSGKSAPMAAPTKSSKTTPSPSSSFLPDQDSLFRTIRNSDYPNSSNFDDVFPNSKSTSSNNNVNFDSKFSSMPVFDKPVYDDDDVVSSSHGNQYNDIFAPKKGGGGGSSGDVFDDLLGGLGKKKEPLSAKSTSKGGDKGVSSFDDLLPGFGGISSTNRSSFDATKNASSKLDNPFVVLESTSPHVSSSSGVFSDPLEEIGKLNNMGSKNLKKSSGGGIFDDIDPHGGFAQSAHPSSAGMNARDKEESPLRRGPKASGRQTSAGAERGQNSSVTSPEKGSGKKVPVEEFGKSSHNVYDMPSVSADFGRSVPDAPSPLYNNSSFGTSSHGHVSPPLEENLGSFDEVWLTVSEIPLLTQPTAAPPPSKPPPPRPRRFSSAGAGSFSASNAQSKVNECSPFSGSNQYFQSPKSPPAGATSSYTSPFDELEEFATGRKQSNADENSDLHSGDDFDSNSVAAASAAAMKEAMDRAEAKFRYARGVRERDTVKVARSRESLSVEKEVKGDNDAQDREFREGQERLMREREQRDKEEEERRRREEDRRRIEKEQEEKEREKRRVERERELARQAVERATREARERAAIEARTRAERAAVQKANSEARERAERAAVQRAQAEARERAAADAKERAEKAAAEAREKTRFEAREKEARERATAASTASQQNSEPDLDSIFGVGTRASSAPRPRETSSSKPAPEATRTAVNSTSSMRKASSSTSIVNDLTSIFGGRSAFGDFPDVDGETEDRRRARLERHHRTQERAAKALADKNARDLEAQREQAERNRISETLDAEIKRWSAGKEGNLRALLSTLQYVLWPECGWQPVSLTDLITGASVKKVYRKATLCIHPDKVQQKGANLQQKYVAEKVFDLLKEAWNKFNSEELF